MFNYGNNALTLAQVSTFRARISQTMETFGREYEAALGAETRRVAQLAASTQQEAFVQFLGGQPIRASINVFDVPQQVYDAAHKRVMSDGLNLSQRIWQMQSGAANLLERDIMAAQLRGASAADMARRIGRYLLPGKELPKGNVPSASFSNQPRDVSYNAFRLARTEINQTWHDVHNATDKKLAAEGIVLGSRWKLSATHRARMLAATDGKSGRDICDDWAERLPGSPILKGQPDAGNAAELAMLAKLEQYGIDAHGVYLPGRTPVDHPNGLCIVQSVLVPREEILRRYGF